MRDDLEAVRDDAGPTEPSAAGAGTALEEVDDFRRLWQEEGLGQARQDREERKVYATRIFLLVSVWLGVIVALVVLQGVLGGPGWFSLSDSVLIAVATTTTASVTALLVVVVRYLFRAPSLSRRNGVPRSRGAMH